MIRYCLARMIGTGTFTDPYRAKAHDYTKKVASISRSDPTTGAPVHAWCLCQIDLDALTTKLRNDTEIVVLPDVALDAPLRALSAANRTALTDALARFNVPLALDPDDTFGMFLRKVGRLIESDFTETRLAVRR